MRTISEDSSTTKDSSARKTSDRDRTEGASEAIADLLDLELELNSIQQGISQMERITPSDPFGDSFAPPPPTVVAKLPPPPAKSSTSTTTPSTATTTSTTTSVSTVPTISSAVASGSSKNWFTKDTNDLFDEPSLPSIATVREASPVPVPDATTAKVGRELCQFKLIIHYSLFQFFFI